MILARPIDVSFSHPELSRKRQKVSATDVLYESGEVLENTAAPTPALLCTSDQIGRLAGPFGQSIT